MFYLLQAAGLVILLVIILLVVFLVKTHSKKSDGELRLCFSFCHKSHLQSFCLAGFAMGFGRESLNFVVMSHWVEE